ncbi:hypothetical protein D3C81_1475200 [compost metagenome]
MAQTVRVHQAPGQRLHAAEAAAHDRGELRDAERVGHARLRIDPVLHRHHREGRAIRLAGRGIHAHRPGRAEARTQVVDADDEEAVGVERLARTHHVVPPAQVARVVGVDAGDMVRGVERVAHQHRVGARRVERAVGLDHQVVAGEGRAVAQLQRLGKVHALRRDHADRIGRQRGRQRGERAGRRRQGDISHGIRARGERA